MNGLEVVLNTIQNNNIMYWIGIVVILGMGYYILRTTIVSIVVFFMSSRVTHPEYEPNKAVRIGTLIFMLCYLTLVGCLGYFIYGKITRLESNNCSLAKDSLSYYKKVVPEKDINKNTLIQFQLFKLEEIIKECEDGKSILSSK